MYGDKVLFLTTSLDSGGIETYLLRYLNFDIEIEAFVLCKSGSGGQLEGKYIDRIGHDRIIKFKIGYFDVLSWIRLYRLIKTNRITIVCDFTGEVSGMTMLIAKLAKVKRRLTFYRHSQFHFKETLLRKMYIKLMKLLIENYSTKILSNSRAALDFFHTGWEENSEKYKVIYNGISAEFYNTAYSNDEVRKLLNIPINAFVVGHTGRLSIAKNHPTILKVAQMLCRDYPNVHFILAGNGTEELEVNEFQDRIHILGYRSDISKLLSAIDLFYFPSLDEGQPNSLIEAMVKGVAIVASDIAPIKESVSEMLLNELIMPNDYESAYNKISKAIMDKEYIESLKCKDWAIHKYNADILFTEFKSEL